MEKQRALQPQNPPDGALIGPDLQNAQVAVSQDNLDEAVNLALRAMASASLARDGEQVAWQVPSIARGLASRKVAGEVRKALSSTLGVAANMVG